MLHVTRSHKRTKDVVTRRVFESPKAPNAFGGRWGSLIAPPDPLAAIGGGILLLRGRKRGRGENGG